MSTTDFAPLDDEAVAINWAARQVRTLQDWCDQNDRVIDAVEVASANLERVEKALKKVQALCRKYNQPNPRAMFSPTSYTVRFTLEQWIDGERCYIPKIKRCQQMVTITPTVVGQDGWEIVGKVTHLDGENAVVAAFPGKVVPDFKQWNTPECEHCGKVRRRNETFIVEKLQHRNQDGTLLIYKQVGKDCLQEFMGVSPAHALALAAFYQATGVANSTDRYEEPIEDWLTWVAVAVRLDGRYWSKPAADEFNDTNRYDGGARYGYREQQTTVNRTYALQSAATFDRKAAEAAGEVPTDADREMVERVRAWVLTLDPANQYQRNLLAIFRAGILVQGTHGLAASAFSGYLRDERKRREEAEAATRPVSRHLGVPGQKLSFRNVRVTGVHVSTREFTTWIYGFQTQEGDVLKWFSSRDMDLEFGQELATLSGTVKGHSEWQGRLETVLTRCRIG